MEINNPAGIFQQFQQLTVSSLISKLILNSFFDWEEYLVASKAVQNSITWIQKI